MTPRSSMTHSARKNKDFIIWGMLEIALILNLLIIGNKMEAGSILSSLRSSMPMIKGRLWMIKIQLLLKWGISMTGKASRSMKNRRSIREISLLSYLIEMNRLMENHRNITKAIGSKGCCYFRTLANLMSSIRSHLRLRRAPNNKKCLFSLHKTQIRPSQIRPSQRKVRTSKS